MQALAEDLAQYGKKGSVHTSILDCLGFDSDVPSQPHVQMLLTDLQTISIGNAQTLFPASN